MGKIGSGREAPALGYDALTDYDTLVVRDDPRGDLAHHLVHRR